MCRVQGQAETVPAFLVPTCKRCQMRRDQLFKRYVIVASLMCERSEVVSAGQVAFQVHGATTHRLTDFSDAVDHALSNSGAFSRASMLNPGQLSDVLLWRKS